MVQGLPFDCKVCHVRIFLSITMCILEGIRMNMYHLVTKAMNKMLAHGCKKGQSILNFTHNLMIYIIL